MPHRIFITGGTGYIGSSLVPLLVQQGHQVRALVRAGSEAKLKGSCEIVRADALNGESYREMLGDSDTFIHLVGVPHPSPAKAREFVDIDLKSAQEAIRVAAASGVRHFMYLSVAHPAPVMKTYIEVREQCENTLRSSGMNATVVRPWYVLGPGHRWPILLKPLYRIAELIPSMHDGALRLGLVTRDEMVRTLAFAVNEPATGTRILGVPEIRSFRAQTRGERQRHRIAI